MVSCRRLFWNHNRNMRALSEKLCICFYFDSVLLAQQYPLQLLQKPQPPSAHHGNHGLAQSQGALPSSDLTFTCHSPTPHRIALLFLVFFSFFGSFVWNCTLYRAELSTLPSLLCSFGPPKTCLKMYRNLVCSFRILWCVYEVWETRVRSRTPFRLKLLTDQFSTNLFPPSHLIDWSAICSHSICRPPSSIQLHTAVISHSSLTKCGNDATMLLFFKCNE